MTIEVTKSGTIIATGAGIDRFIAATLKSAINLYLKTGMKPNRMYTPTNMLAKAGSITGKTYKRGQLKAAHDDLAALLA